MSNEPLHTILEKRIAASLANNVASADDLAALIAETEAAITQADATAEAEHTKAFDLVLSPDATAAREAMQAAEFARDRLHAVLPGLRARLYEVHAQECLAQWQADYEALKIKRDALAAELREFYPEFETKITDLFARIAANDEELSRLHLARPANVALHLLGAELFARGLRAFTGSEPSVLETLKLPKFKPDERLAWPPPQPFVAAPVVLGGDSRLYSGDRWQVQQEQAKAAAELAAREDAEREAKALENYHGPRWWERA